MNHNSFVTQIMRLQDAFGKQFFSEERTNLIWRECKDFSDFWFEKIVDEFISSMRQAPLPSDFSEAASKERERLYRIESEKNRLEQKRFSQMLMKEAPVLFDILRKIGNGFLSEESLRSAIKMIEHAAKEAERMNCETCSDSGLVLTENPFSVRKCSCHEGLKRLERF